MGNKEINLIACKSGKTFANKIFDELNKINGVKAHIIKTKEVHFVNTEIKTEILESIRGEKLFIIQDVVNKETKFSVDENIMALKTAIDASHRANASEINVILPTYPYARQDKSISREGITSSLIARELESLGIERVITLDIHNPTIAGFFNKTVLENLNAIKNISDWVRKNIDLKELVIISPDAGGVKRAEKYAEKLSTPLAIIHKQRDYAKSSVVNQMILVGNVKDKSCLIVDDMIATAGTSIKAAELLKENGAREVYLACSLPFFDTPAIDRLDKAYKDKLIKQVIGTDVITHTKDTLNKKWFVRVSVAKYFAKVIYNLNVNKSISRLLTTKN